MEALDQRLRLGIGVGIEPLVRMAVAGQETLSRSTSPLSAWPTITGPPAPGLQQADAAQDQRAHDALAQLGLRHQQRAQAFRRDDQGFHRALRVGIDQRRPARQLRQLAHERAGPMRDDELAAPGLIVLRDLDFAGQDDRQPLARPRRP